MVRNVAKAYCKDGSFSALNRGNKYNRHGAYQHGRSIVKCLGMDRGAQIAQLKSALAEEVAGVKEVEDEAKKVKQEGQGVQQEVARLNGQLKEVVQRKRQAETQLKKLREEQEEADDTAVDTTDWEREVEAQQAKIVKKQAELEAVVKNLHAKEEARKGKENEKRQYQKTMEETQVFIIGPSWAELGRVGSSWVELGRVRVSWVIGLSLSTTLFAHYLTLR